MRGSSVHGKREIPLATRSAKASGPPRESSEESPRMNASGKSDGPIRPQKPANKGGGRPSSAESVEERGPAKGNSDQTGSLRTQSRGGLSPGLDRVRQVARRDKKVKFTTLLHHIYSEESLRTAYLGLNPDAAPGVDRLTWAMYGQDLEDNLQDLHARIARGAYRAQPVQRVYIPKADGRQRPLGIPTLEDKIVQRATTEVLNAIYETDFLGFSYGFRLGRGAHDALDALSVGIERKKVNWVLDADIQGFFDALDKGWLRKFLEHRIADQRVLHLIQKWLNAGVLEDDEWRQVERGTPQGGSISPLLANVYLHYVLDLWVDHWRRANARGDVIFVRYADDFLVGFQDQGDAERFRNELQARLATFGLTLHPDKTRLLEFGRFAASNRERRGQGKPETFAFLGFTHICGRTRQGRFIVRRKTIAKRLRAKLKALRIALRKCLHADLYDVGRWLGMVIGGYDHYFAVPGNLRTLQRFREQLTRAWFAILRRRSQRFRLTWLRMRRLVKYFFPALRLHHPYPSQRLVV
jgi:group II intron reverse transcriptase/maturase